MPCLLIFINASECFKQNLEGSRGRGHLLVEVTGSHMSFCRTVSSFKGLECGVATLPAAA
jgi:hypothetical protein